MAENRSTRTLSAQKRTSRTQAVDRSTLSSIARGMQYAVNSTQEIMEDHYARIFDKYFDKDGNPITVKFNVSPEQIVQAPLIALVPLNSLVLEEMIVEMSVEIIDTASKKVGAKAADTNVDRTSFTVSFSFGKRTDGKTEGETEQRNNTINIVMKFKRGDPPEGVARVLDEFYKAVVTSRTEKEGK